MDDLNKSRSQPGITSENDANIVKSLGILTDQLTVEENKLNAARDRAKTIQEALESVERRRNDLIREQAWRQNEAYYSLLKMTGAHSEFNRLMSLGNTLLSARNGLVKVPMALPQASVSDKDAKALLNKQRQAELAGLTGIAKVNRQVDFDLQDMGRSVRITQILRNGGVKPLLMTITTRRTWQRHRKQKQTPPGKLKRLTVMPLRRLKGMPAK
jgi:phage-related minor tail protein